MGSDFPMKAPIYTPLCVLKGRCSIQMSYGRKNGRGREIRTPDILLPKQARYQTALYPDFPPGGGVSHPGYAKGGNHTVELRQGQCQTLFSPSRGGSTMC
jgi:hypothetical protein